MITFVSGNFFDYDAHLRVNTVNCVGVMGAGVALQFKNKFPKMYEEYVKECNLGRVKIGKPHVWKDNEIFNSSPIIINFPTKDDWKKPSEYEYVDKGLIWLKEFLNEKDNCTITIPALGCGHGGLQWDRVKRMIEDYLGDLKANILVFEPSSSVAENLGVEDIAMLKAKEILRLLPGDTLYPKKLIGKSASEIYLKGDRNIFDNKILSIIVDTKANDRERTAVIDCLKTLPNDNFVYALSYNSSFEIDLVKEILFKNSKLLLVFPYGIFNIKIRKDLREIWDESKITFVSISKPKQSWSVYESINALKFRIKISDALLIANYNYEPLMKYEKDFKEANNSIFFINYWNEKIDFYDRVQGIQIGRDRNTQRPNISSLYKRLH